jgi:starch phosphorylase
VQALKSRGYRPMDYYAANPQLRDVIDLLRGGFFTRGDTALLQPLLDNLMQDDPYMLFADFASYLECQEQVSAAYRDPEQWTRMTILNTARSGKFSSDRSIREYSADIWQVEPVPITLLPQEQSLTPAEFA